VRKRFAFVADNDGRLRIKLPANIIPSVNNNNAYGRNMSATQAPANLAEMVRDRAKSRGDALAYEFEGRQTSFAEFDIKTNRVANALIALGVKPGERIAYLGKNSDIYFELLMGAMKAKVVIRHASAQHQAATAGSPHHHHHRRRRAGMAGLYGVARRAEWRRSEAADQPAGHRDPALYVGHNR
jgi:acyl-CoA synthetase (AMP-forming)/AMP-acid ligase II